MDANAKKLNKDLAYYIASLCISAINQKRAVNKPNHLTWKNIYQLAQFHNIEGICYYSIVDFQANMDRELFKNWTKAKDQTLLRSLQFFQERKKILEALHLHEIATLPVKGAVIEALYPNFGMRFMSDNDILYCYKGEQHIDKEEITRLLVRIMKSFHYEVGSISGHQKAFYKKPCFNFELHESLFREGSSYYSSFNNIWQSAKETAPLQYEISLEEQYIYCIAHGAKHYYAYGTGLRLLCDVAAYLSQTQEMNWSYINSRLQTLDLLTFEQRLKNLYYEIKDLQSLSEQSEEMLKTLISAGTYGHMARGIDNRIKQIKATGKQHGKMIYLKNRLFMNSADLALRYPHLSRIWGINKLLIILRMLSAICFSSRRIVKELILVIQR